MAERVIALTVGTASIPIYADDWPAVKKVMEEALAGKPGRACRTNGSKERVQAVRLTVADTSRLAAGAEHGG